MRCVIQRVSRGEVRVDGKVTGAIGKGVLVLVGVARGDTGEDARYLAGKIAGLRIFEDEQNQMNNSILDACGSALVVSQFTLYGSVRKGRRPSFERAAPPAEAIKLYDRFVEFLRAEGVPVETGVFQARMEVDIVNSGPVTILCDSEKTI